MPPRRGRLGVRGWTLRNCKWFGVGNGGLFTGAVVGQDCENITEVYTLPIFRVSRI